MGFIADTSTYTCSSLQTSVNKIMMTSSSTSTFDIDDTSNAGNGEQQQMMQTQNTNEQQQQQQLNLNPSPPHQIFQAVVEKDYNGLIQIFAENARDSVLSFISMKSRWARQQQDSMTKSGTLHVELS
ncbi:MAG: hypothetical protein ACI90V_011516 [Bacillariaceae sp.]